MTTTPQPQTEAERLASEYRPTMTPEVLHSWAVDAQAMLRALAAELAQARAERDGLRAARMAYASEFPLNADGEPDVGSIHANIRALKAELEGLKAQGQWLPIETAPEDMPERVAVRWVDSDGQECRVLDYTEDGCWMGWSDHAEHVEIIGGHGVSYTPPYEHWMPLPAPPTGEV